MKERSEKTMPVSVNFQEIVTILLPINIAVLNATDNAMQRLKALKTNPGKLPLTRRPETKLRMGRKVGR
jgi:hypothetical protein